MEDPHRSLPMAGPVTTSLQRRPKVLHCVSRLALGGAERVALTISKALSAEYDFEFFAVRGVADDEMGRSLFKETVDAGILVHLGVRVPMRYGGVVTSAFGLARVLRLVSPDILHLHTEIPEAAYAAMLLCFPTRGHLPVVRTIHNAVFWDFWRGFGRWADRRLARAGVAAVSHAALRGFAELRKASGATQPPVAPVVIYNGVAAPPGSNAAASRGGNVLRLVFGGRFELQKGTDLLRDILQRVQLPPGMHAELTLYGSGSHEPILRRLASAPPAQWNVHLCAPIADFPQRLREYDLLIVPSRFEGLGLVAVEALLAGVPVVATYAPGLAEVFPDGYPWLAAPGDGPSFACALQAAIDQRTLWPGQMARASAYAAARFSPVAMAAGYRTLYRGMLSVDPALFPIRR